MTTRARNTSGISTADPGRKTEKGAFHAQSTQKAVPPLSGVLRTADACALLSLAADLLPDVRRLYSLRHAGPYPPGPGAQRLQPRVPDRARTLGASGGEPRTDGPVPGPDGEPASRRVHGLASAAAHVPGVGKELCLAGSAAGPSLRTLDFSGSDADVSRCLQRQSLPQHDPAFQPHPDPAGAAVLLPSLGRAGREAPAARLAGALPLAAAVDAV